MIRLSIILLLIALVAPVSAHDYVPGEPQSQPILLKGGDLYTVSGGVMTSTDLLFDNGRITQIGPNLDVPEGALVIDVTGKHVYPGLIDANTSIGLIEIGAVRATDDRAEVGSVTPEASAYIAYNTDSEVIPVNRSAGVTTVLSIPLGSGIRGLSALMNLDGWTREDATVKPITALHIAWPRARVISSPYIGMTPDEQREQSKKRRERIYEAFDEAYAYYLTRRSDEAAKIDTRWEALAPVFDQELPVIVHATSARQIDQAVAFAQQYKLDLILSDAREAYRRLDLLKKHKIPVILYQMHSMPVREDDDYDITFKLPRLLDEAGVAYCIATRSHTLSRNLAIQAGQAVAFGLSPDAALRAVTLSPAEILGVSDALGSLEIGKSATLFITSGDILDFTQNQAELMFIEGRRVDLDNKHKELWRKYRQKGSATSR